jgi:hypothetical protein
MLRHLVMPLGFIALSALVFIPVAARSAPPGLPGGMPGGIAQPQPPSVGQSFMTPRGPGFVTGNTGSVATAIIPQSHGTQGFLINNGNGTDTLIVPGSAPQIVTSPR